MCHISVEVHMLIAFSNMVPADQALNLFPQFETKCDHLVVFAQNSDRVS